MLCNRKIQCWTPSGHKKIHNRKLYPAVRIQSYMYQPHNDTTNFSAHNSWKRKRIHHAVNGKASDGHKKITLNFQDHFSDSPHSCFSLFLQPFKTDFVENKLFH